MNKNQLILFSPEDLIIIFLGLYNQEYGNKKGVGIVTKIQSSKRIRDFIIKLRTEKLSPGYDGFITIVNSLPYFFFSKGETLGYGALFAIRQWIEQSYKDEFKLDYFTLNKIVVETIFRAEKTTINISGNLTFFDKYFDHLEKVLENSINNVEQQSFEHDGD
ncbi:MAG: hypothetical protein ABJB05_08185 [Parafilimonas sp.]